ncbi:MAG: FAD-dependent oxidoreductase [Ignisphaera sp.]
MKFAFLSMSRTKDLGKRVAIIGAGPAGLSVTGYLVTRGFEVDVYEKLPLPGGLMTFAIPSNKIDVNGILEGCKDLEQNFGVKFYFKTKVASGRGVETGDEFVEKVIDFYDIIKKYDAVVVATGTWESKKLNIPGENAANVIPALELLYRIRLSELGYTSNIKLPNRVIIVGGGLSAVDAVEECLNRGVKEVYWIYRRTAKEAPAGIYNINRLVNRGVKFLELTQPIEILTENNVVKAVKLVKMKFEGTDESGRPKPVPVPGSEFVLETDMVITAIGEKPTPPIGVGDLAKYVGDDGRLLVDLSYRVPGTSVFAAGDVVQGPTKIGLAVDHGLKVARSLDKLVSGSAPKIAEMIASLPKARYIASYTKWADAIGKSTCGFLATRLGIEEGKCLSGKPFLKIIDYNKCIGCETCSAICGFLHDGKPLIKIEKTEDGVVIPITCMHCTNAKCAEACKRKAIVRGSMKEVLIDYSKCNNCLDCVYACPIRAIRIRGGRAVNCDLCKALREHGLPPACISMCPSNAIMLYAT